MTTPMPTKKVKTVTPQELEEGRAKAKRLIDKARAFIVLDHPFFASIMLKHPFVERLDVPTLAVNPRGTIFYNPMFIAEQEPEQVVWAICHEILHYASGHPIRRQSREMKKWNIAGDMWINDTLNRSGVGKKIEGCLDVPGSADRTVEDIYASFPPDDDGDGEGPGNDPNGPKRKGGTTGQGDGDGDGDPLQDDMEDDGDLSDAEKAEIDGERKIEVSEAAQVAKAKGKLPGVLQKFAEATVESKVPWFDILERFMSERTKQDYSWARPNRRYMPDFYLPTIDGVAAMGPIVIQVDISGSISRQEVRHYNGHMKRIIEQCRPSKVHVIYTDTQVQRHDEFDKPEDVEIGFYSGGGTHMPAGFKYVEEQGIEAEVVVTLTDGYSSWDTEPPFPTVHCISSDQKAPYGENIKFELGAE